MRRDTEGDRVIFFFCQAEDGIRELVRSLGLGDVYKRQVILQDGKIINGTWKKSSRLDRTKYFDSSGKLIKFNRGRIWIAAIANSSGKFDIIEQ